jgi:hypothetical protein
MKMIKFTTSAAAIAWAGATLSGATTAASVVPQTASHGLSATTAQSRASTLGYVKNRHSGKCLTVHGASKANNARVDQYTCVGRANQRWRFEWTGGITYALRNENSGKCLTVHGASKAKGAHIDQYTCVGASNQSFRINIPTPSRTQIVPTHSGKCLDVQGGSKANNAPVIQWTCNGRSNQLWSTP